MSDISAYLNSVCHDADKPLFKEAVTCASISANRAAYILVWICCAESLKWRFREAAKRDNHASKIVGKIEQKEANHQSVDKYLLEKGKEYGFISDTEYALLLDIYELRCVYGHPYEQAPLDEQVRAAAAVAVEALLGKPVRLKHGFCKALLTHLLEEPNFLDDSSKSVRSFARTILPKVDESILPWFFSNYLRELEAIADDPTLRVFWRRGVYFCRTFMIDLGTSFISFDDWHQHAIRYPKSLLAIVSKRSLFEGIGERAGDTLVGNTIDFAAETPAGLRCLEAIDRDCGLSQHQRRRFDKYIISMAKSTSGAKRLRQSRLSVAICYPAIIEGLKSYNWYIQSPFIKLIGDQGASGLQELGDERQEIIGRNVLQTAHGEEMAAEALLRKDDLYEWPAAFLRGLLSEMFTNEVGKLRFKTHFLQHVLTIIGQCSNRDREEILDIVTEWIRGSKPKDDSLEPEDFDDVDEIVQSFEWAEIISSALQSKKEALFQNQFDEE